MSGKNVLKSSLQRAIRIKIQETYPEMAVDEILDKKANLNQIKWYLCFPSVYQLTFDL